MPIRTSLTPNEFRDAVASLGFSFLESSCFCTTYVRGGDLLSIEEPTADVYEDLELAFDFAMSADTMAALHATYKTGK